MPLMWAHAEYVKLLRSARDGMVFDLIPEVAQRYRNGKSRAPLEVWKLNRRIPTVSSGSRLRIQVSEPFVLHWGRGEWESPRDTHSIHTAIGIDYADIEVESTDRSPLRFTFYWKQRERWEGRDFAVMIV